MKIAEKEKVIYCANCNLAVAKGDKFLVVVRGKTYHDNCYEQARRAHKFLLLVRSSAGICSED